MRNQISKKVWHHSQKMLSTEPLSSKSNGRAEILRTTRILYPLMNFLRNFHINVILEHHEDICRQLLAPSPENRRPPESFVAVIIFDHKKGITFNTQPLEFYGAPAGIRTQDLRIRSPLLYPAELQARIFKGLGLLTSLLLFVKTK